MKTITTGLRNFLGSATQMAMADLYTLTLRDGSTVIRWTNVEASVSDGSNSFAPMRIERSALRASRGASVDTLTVRLVDDGSTVITGTPVIPFLLRGGMDGATLLLRRAFFDRFGGTLQGLLTLFAGRVADVRDCTRTEASLEVAAWTELLNVQMPRHLIQPACLNTLYDAGCGLDPNSFKLVTAVASGSSVTAFRIAATPAVSLYALGKLVFTSGVCAGQVRTCKSQDTSGNITLASPLPAVPAAGDGVTLYQGCDRTLSTCVNKFNNRLKYRGMPFVPVAETSL